MKLNNEDGIIQLVKNDQWMMDILRAVKTLNLPDWWVCAGFVRSKIWDVLHGFRERTTIPDVDVIYFDKSHVDEAEEKKLEEKLSRIAPGIPWSVKNEARMHVINNLPPYSSAVDAISKFPETATALGLSLDEQNHVVLTAPCGIEDVIHLEVKPTPYFKETKERAQIYEERLRKKNWKGRWNKIKVFHIELEALKELTWEYEVVRRVQKADANPDHSSSLKEIMDEEEYKEFQTMNVDKMSDDELFEDDE